MTTYLDSSIVVPIYVSEVRSAEAVGLLAGLGPEAAVSPLTDVEVAAAMQKHLSPSKQDGYSFYKQDRASGLYRTLEIDPVVFELAQGLAEVYASKYFLRSLDILHLAILQRHRITHLGTFDERMAQAAAALKLTVLPTRS